MKPIKQMVRIVASFLLLAALMLPSAIQFSHILEGHEHKSCTDTSTHLHQNDADCQICDFHLVPFNFEVAFYPDFLRRPISQKVTDRFYAPLFNSFRKSNTQLRAPPHFFV